MKNKWVAGILYLIVAGQVGAGISKLALSPMHPGQHFRYNTYTIEPRN